jgi:hypothetical protein
MTEPLAPGTIERLAQLAGLVPPAEDMPLLAAVLEAHRVGERAIAALDLSDVEPILSFDPRWK